jgi:ABC-type hemin transport system ATPase subunit
VASRAVPDRAPLSSIDPPATGDLTVRTLVLHKGRLLSSGEPEPALSETVRAAFGLRSSITPHPLTGRPHLTSALLE